MKIDTRWILPLALGLVIAIPASGWAQGRGNARGHQKQNRQEQRRVIVLDDDDNRDRIRVRERDRAHVRNRDRDRIINQFWDRNRDWNDRERIVLRDRGRTIVLYNDDFVWFPVRNDRGPSFCRSGAGHPVFGLQWCLNKGYGIGRPGSVFLWGDDVFLRDRTRVIVLRDRRYDADQAFWSAVVGQVLALVD